MIEADELQKLLGELFARATVPNVQRRPGEWDAVQ